MLYRNKLAYAASHSKRIHLAGCLNDAEREAVILENITHYLPGLNEPLSFDYSSLVQDGKTEELLLVAARQELINAYLEITAQANLKVRIMDVDIYALARVLSMTKEAQVFFDVDATLGHLVLWKNGEMITAQQILINTTDESLAQQLKRALLALNSAAPGSHIEKIILTGKKKYFCKLSQLLQQEMSLHIEIPTIWQRFDVSEKINKEELNQHESELLAALGLVLRTYPKW